MREKRKGRWRGRIKTREKIKARKKREKVFTHKEIRFLLYKKLLFLRGSCKFPCEPGNDVSGTFFCHFNDYRNLKQDPAPWRELSE
jgi:hypothetical protein